MGVDMYIYQCVRTKEKHTPEQVYNINLGLSDGEWTEESMPFGALRIAPFGGFTLFREYITWRDALHIHHWIAKNCNDGKDYCRLVELTHPKLKQLKIELEKSLEEKIDSSTPSKYFPCAPEDFDEYYWPTIERTLKEISVLLKIDWYSFRYFYAANG